MNDTISRSAIIAELEAYKMSLGDIVLRFVVDRVIDVVKNFKVKEEPPAPKQVVQHRDCMTCKYLYDPFAGEPCQSCSVDNGYKNWEFYK